MDHQENVSQSRLVFRRELPMLGVPTAMFTPLFAIAHQRLGRAYHRTAGRQQDYQAVGRLHWAGGTGVCANRSTPRHVSRMQR